MKIKFSVFIFSIFLLAGIAQAQNQKKIDSLNIVLAAKIHDTARVQTNYQLACEYVFAQPATALNMLRNVLHEARKKNMKHEQAATMQSMGITLCVMRHCDSSEYFMLQAKTIYEEINYKKGIAGVCGALANVHMLTGNYDAALLDFKKVIEMNRAIGNKKGLLGNYINIASIYIDQGNYQLAMDNLLKGKKTSIELKDDRGILKANINMGNLFILQKDYPKALVIFREAESLSKDQEKGDIATIANNLGIILSSLNDTANARKYFEKALTLRLELGDKMGIANIFLNFADYYLKIKQTEKALDCYRASAQNAEEGNDPYILSAAKGMIGQMLNEKKDYASAKKYCTEGLAIAEKINVNLGIESCLLCLFQVNEGLGNYKEALNYHKRYIATRDSFKNLENEKALFQKTTQFEYEKKASADSVKNAEEQKVKNAQLQAQSASLKQEKTQRYALYGGLVLVAGFLIFVINRFRITNKQKKIIEEQKTQVDLAFEKLHEKNKEVMDSIHYAKRIQTALLPNEKYIERALKTHK